MSKKINKVLCIYFSERFEDYYRLKKYNGSLDLKTDPMIAQRIGTRFYGVINDIIDWDKKKIKELFHYLEFECAHFIEADKFYGLVKRWCLDKSGAGVYSLSEEFKGFLNELHFACMDIWGTDYDQYRRVDAMTNTLTMMNELRKPFLDKHIDDCKIIFWNWLKVNKVDEIIIHNIEFQIKTNQIEAAKKIKELTGGKGFIAQNQQTEVNNLINEIVKEEESAPNACGYCKKEILKSDSYINCQVDRLEVKYHTKCYRIFQKEMNNVK